MPHVVCIPLIIALPGSKLPFPSTDPKCTTTIKPKPAPPLTKKCNIINKK